MSKLKPTYDVGYTSEATTGEVFTVVDYQGRKNIKIRFECGNEKNTTSTDIKQGRVKYYFKRTIPVCVGTRFESKEGEVVEVVEVKPKKRYVLRFPDGTEKSYGHASLNSGDITIKGGSSVKVGERYPTTTYGYITIVEYHNANRVDVVFDDGTLHSAQVSSIKRGNVRHPKSGVPEGYIFTNSDGCSGRVAKFTSPTDVDVLWYDGIITRGHAAANVKSGAIYYPNAKTVCGVGYFGIGKHKSNKSGGSSTYDPRIYNSWTRMITRCYNEEEQKKASGKSYIDVWVCDKWHNFQNFCQWAEDNYSDRFVSGFELDKDLFGNGKLYSPEFCTLLPSKVNWFLCNNYSSKVADLPEGVNYIKPATINAKEGYIARCAIEGKRKYLGYYNTPEEAGAIYRDAKEAEARRLADEYKHKLTKRQYDKLKSFTLEDIHRK